MRKECSTKLAIYYLNEEEYSDPQIKNICCCQEELPYIAILYEKVECNLNELEIQLLNSRTRFGIITTQEVSEKITYEKFFESNVDDILGVVLEKKQVERTGIFHPYMKREGAWEFCCRVLEEIGECFCFYVEDKLYFAEEITADDRAIAYAYVVRHHINKLHSIGLTNSVFQRVCLKMQEWDCFREFQDYMHAFLSDKNEYERIAAQTAPFLILKGDDTCYGVLQTFAEDLGDALKKLGQSVIMIGDDPGRYDDLQGKVYKGIIGFQTRALEIDFFRKLSGPKIQFWMDYPLHFKGVLRNLPSDYLVLCQDGGHAKLIREYFHTSGAVHFPLGGKCKYDAGEAYVDRPYDIVFVGSYFPDNGLSLIGEEKEFYDFMLTHPNMTFEEGIKELRRGITDEELVEGLYLLKPACRAIIGHFREKIIEQVLKTGVELHVYGEEWNKYPNASDNLVIHPNVTVEKSLEELRKAKIALNVMSWHKDGMTERIANIMLSGAVCLTEESKFLREYITDGEELVLYSLTDLISNDTEKITVENMLTENNSITKAIYFLLNDENKRKDIADKAMKMAEEMFSWRARAEELINITGRYWEGHKLY